MFHKLTTNLMQSQVHVESWRVGFGALTSPSKNREKIHGDFIGNALDFVRPNVTGSELTALLPHVFTQHFATFMFKTEEAATLFLRAANRSVEPGARVFATVAEKRAENLVSVFQRIFK